MDVAFAGRTAVITGASSGIGRALALVLASRGCRVGLMARRRGALDEVAAAVRSAGGVAAVAAADVGDRSQVRDAVSELTGSIGPVDLLIANAGVGVPTTLEPINVGDVEDALRVNVLGVVYAIDAVLPGMLARGSGHLAAVSSLAGYRGLPGESAYCASKAAVNAYMEGLRVQLRGRGVDVTTICPGFVRTPMTAPNTFPMPFLLEPDEAAERIVRALRRRARVYNFPWPMAALMKLTRWAPDWLMARAFQDYLENPPMPQAETAPTRGE
ncbi:MAG: SDR family NAD(P)-dependent oxidoreductase [Planctomycetia bacterium]|nr:SDR family NAD(P)-dependent oxidoreductase [Planctomycetia bacterium]